MGNNRLETPPRRCKTLDGKTLNKDDKNNDCSNSSVKMYLPQYISNVLYPAHAVDYACPTNESVPPSIVNSDSSETTLSVRDINIVNKVPMLIPRDHGSNCILEVSILEKHKKGCPNKKILAHNINPIDDKVGSYDVINRVVYKTCSLQDQKNPDNTIKNSPKGFNLNDPTAFGKDLREKRSRIEAVPILPEPSTYNVLHTQPQSNSESLPQHQLRLQAQPQSLVQSESHIKPAETVSIYIRMDKTQAVPKGFQKMHYRGDSCKVKQPSEKSKQLLALKKVIVDTTSAAAVSKSLKAFSPVVSENPALNTEIRETALPETFTSNELRHSNDSLEIVEYKTTVNTNKEQQTEGTRSVGCSENKIVHLENRVHKELDNASNSSICVKQTNKIRKLKKKKARDENN